MYIIIIILLIITILSIIIYYKKKLEKIEKNLYNKIENEVEQNFINKRREELENNLLIESAKAKEAADLRHEIYLGRLKEEQSKLEGIIKTGEETIRQLEKRKEEQTKLIEATIADKKKIVDVEVQAYREVETQKAATAVESATKTKKAEMQASLWAYEDEVRLRKENLQAELLLIQSIINDAKNELDDYRKRQQAINEAILRQRELDEKQDFYRVVLSEFAIEDISLLQEIRQKLHTTESFNKLIYDVYVSKQVQEMVKRVLQGGAPSGIYKITRLKTGEIYIGKSTNVKDRWQQHCKTVFGAGTIAHSILHTTMQRDGLQNFTFELIEEVPKEKLSEREKYWINFYGSRDYGLNERCG